MCASETVNIFLYSQKIIPKINEIMTVYMKYIITSLNPKEFLITHMGICQTAQTKPTNIKAVFFPFAEIILFSKKPRHAISSTKAVTNRYEQFTAAANTVG